jgi:hypothetical protein
VVYSESRSLCRIAHRSRVPVPVPGAADVAASLDDADVRDAGLLQAGARHQPREAAADNHDHRFVEDGYPVDRLRITVLQEVRKATSRLQVLVVPVRSQPFLSLGAVLPPQFLPVDSGWGELLSGGTSCGHAPFLPRPAVGTGVDPVTSRLSTSQA